MIERAGDVADRIGRDLRIARRRVELGTSEQHLDHANIDILLQEMGGEAVPQRMLGDACFCDPGRLHSRVAGAGKLTRGDWLVRASGPGTTSPARGKPATNRAAGRAAAATALRSDPCGACSARSGSSSARCRYRSPSAQRLRTPADQPHRPRSAPNSPLSTKHGERTGRRHREPRTPRGRAVRHHRAAPDRRAADRRSDRSRRGRGSSAPAHRRPQAR